MSITEWLTAKHFEILENAKKRLVHSNVWKLDGRIYYLVDGCTKPQIFKNLAKVGCLSYGKICG